MFKKISFLTAALGLILLYACNQNTSKTDNRDESSTISLENEVVLQVEFLNEEGKEKLGDSLSATLLGEGFKWSEGPLWIEEKEMLLFSDIPNNKIFKWTESEGMTEYLHPAGLTTDASEGREPGSNGLIYNTQGQLVLCQHGDHAISVLDADVDAPEAKFTVLVDSYEGKRLNSPNDVIEDSKGQYYFTDPDYGVASKEDKELSFNGVFKIPTSGDLQLLIDSISNPNGLALSPDEKYLFIANSNHEAPYLYKYLLDDEGDPIQGEVFFDFTPFLDKGPGGLDGFKIDKQGYIYTSGPGGIWLISPEGEALAHIPLENRTSNCWLTEDESSLYVTNTDKVFRLKLK